MIDIKPTAIEAVKIITPQRFTDERGYFVETWNKREFDQIADVDFVQDNYSLSRLVGTVRGLHMQSPPSAQNKLVRVLRGRIVDVAVDLRRSSATFGHHVAVELSADNGSQLWVPVGFAHGFVTREPDTEVAYKVTGFYEKTCDLGLRWDDPALGIDWGISLSEAILSDKDRAYPRLAELPEIFM